jgi:hypothetical protein
MQGNESHGPSPAACVGLAASLRGGPNKRLVFQSIVLPLGLLHLMRAVVASRIMRTTIDLDPTVVKELKRRSKGAGKSMGQLASELLATSLREHVGRPRSPGGLTWIAKDMGRPFVDLEDKEAVRAMLDARE